MERERRSPKVWWFKKKEKDSEEAPGRKRNILWLRGDKAGAGRKARLEERKERRRQKKKEKEEKKAREKKISAQNTIPYREMAKDGTCRVKEHTYSRTIRFYDINYQLAQNEDKSAIFESWCDFLNYFDSSIHVQLSFINHKSSMSEYEKVIRIKPKNDAFDDVRAEYAQMLQAQLAKGNNGLVRSKYIRILA